MRTPKRYVAKDGEVSWKVRYRSATGQQKSETFYDAEQADEFCKVLDALGPARAVQWLDDTAAGDTDGHGAFTVADLWTRWFEWKSARKRDGTLLRVRSSRTIADYERMWRARIKPHLGAKPANLIGPGDIQAWVDHLAGELEPKTVGDYHSLLHSMFKWGVHPTRGFIIADPCLDTELPKRRRKKPKGLRPDEWALLYQAALNVDRDAADLLLFLVSTGWRWSEAVAAQTLSVDHYGEGETYVTMGRVLRREDGGHVFVEDEAKSDAGARRVRLMGAAEEMVLRRVYGKGPEDLILTKGNGKPWGYSYFYQLVWTRPKGKRGKAAPNKPRILEEAKKLGLARADQVTPHWLRHTHAAMLILAGEPLTAIQRRLGHASIKTTSDTYGRMIEDASAAGLEKVAALLGGAPTVPQLPAPVPEG